MAPPMTNKALCFMVVLTKVTISCRHSTDSGVDVDGVISWTESLSVFTARHSGDQIYSERLGWIVFPVLLMYKSEFSTHTSPNACFPTMVTAFLMEMLDPCDRFMESEELLFAE